MKFQIAPTWFSSFFEKESVFLTHRDNRLHECTTQIASFVFSKAHTGYLGLKSYFLRYVTGYRTKLFSSLLSLTNQCKGGPVAHRRILSHRSEHGLPQRLSLIWILL